MPLPLLDGHTTSLVRFGADGSSVALAVEPSVVAAGTRIADSDVGITARVRETGQSARIDDYLDLAGAAEFVKASGLRAAVGVPVTVKRRLWGVLGVGSRVGPLPAYTERRLAQLFIGAKFCNVAGYYCKIKISSFINIVHCSLQVFLGFAIR